MTDKLSQRAIFLLWFPLALTWLMMACEGPVLNALIARLADATFNLAANSVAYSICLICEAPILSFLSASAALSRDWSSFTRLRSFAYWHSLGMTLVLALIALTPLSAFITDVLMGLDPQLGISIRQNLIVMILCPFVVGYRRLYQGLLVRHQRGRLVSYGTMIRLSSMCIAGVMAYHYLPGHGALVGAIGLTTGMVCEAIASRLMAFHVVQLLRQQQAGDVAGELGMSDIVQFHYPLALNNIVALSVQPIVSLVVARGAYPLESLAVLPVLSAFLFLFKSLGMAVHEVAVAFLATSNAALSALQTYSRRLGIGITLLFGSIAFSPLLTFWYERVCGLTPDLVSFVSLPTQITLFMPAFVVWGSLQRGSFTAKRQTKYVSIAGALEVSCVCACMCLFVFGTGLSGAVAAALSWSIGSLLSNLYLLRERLGIIKQTHILTLQTNAG